MRSMKTRFRERDPRKVGLVGVLVVGAMLALSLTSGSILRSLTSATYTASFAEASGLTSGAEVRIGGHGVGKVESVKLDRGQVKVRFTVEGPGNLGELTGAAIKTATPLGVKFLAVLPAGGGQLADDAEIPLHRTTSSYDLTTILRQLTERSEEIDSGQLVRALDTVSTALRDTPEELHATLEGVNRLAQTIAGQDQQLRGLLERADTVTGVLAQRNRELSRLFDDGNLLLAELNQRRTVISQLVRTTATLLENLRGLVQDNQHQLRPVLDQLKGVLDILNRDERFLGTLMHGLNVYAGNLGEAVGGGPWFYGYIPNLPPTNLVPLLPDILKAVGP
jgi:phospholipid/cholesterol/gamma-HCH transport system substrate-binding protein